MGIKAGSSEAAELPPNGQWKQSRYSAWNAHFPAQAAFPTSFALSRSQWRQDEGFLSHRAIRCCAAHGIPKPPGCWQIMQSVTVGPRWDFLKLYLNKFLLPSAFDGVSNPTITGFFWVPGNSRPSMCVFLLPICPDLHGWWFSSPLPQPGFLI